MSISQAVRDTLAQSGDRMTAAEIADALAGLHEKNSVAAICSQHAKSGVFGRAMEDGRVVYWMANPDAKLAADTAPVDALATESAPVVHLEPPVATAPPAPVEERPARTTKVVQPKPAKNPAPSLDVERIEAEHQARLIHRATHTAHSLSRMLTHLLADAIEARLEHDALARICTAQQSVQDVHAFLINQR